MCGVAGLLLKRSGRKPRSGALLPAMLGTMLDHGPVPLAGTNRIPGQ